MSTFSADTTGAKEAVSKDNPTPEEIAATEKAGNDTAGAESSSDNPDETDADETVEEVTDPETQDDSAVAEDADEEVVAGAAVGPDPAGVVRNEQGNVAYAPPGSHDAAMNGVQEDASGFVDSIGTDNSHRSGTRI